MGQLAFEAKEKATLYFQGGFYRPATATGLLRRCRL